MISINANAIKLTAAKLQTVRKSVIAKGDKAFRQKVYYLFEATLKVSPQFTGDFASNWFFSVDGNLGSYRMYPGKNSATMRQSATTDQYHYQTHARQAGDMEAITRPLAQAAGFLQNVTMKSRVRFVNLTDLYTDGTHMISPRDKETLRPENVIPGNVRIESFIRALAKSPIPISSLRDSP